MNVRSLPSGPSASFTDSVAEPEDLIVPVEVPALTLMPTPAGNPPRGGDSVTVNVSGPSTSPSWSVSTVNLLNRPVPEASAAKVRVPLALSKSDADAVSSDEMLVA